MTPLIFRIEGFQASAYRDQLEQLEQRFTNFWASVSYPTRLITFTRRFSFAPKRQLLRNSANPLDDVRELIGWINQALESGDQRQLQAFIHKRSASIQRALATLHDAADAADLISLAGYGEASAGEL
ncbi:MAG TPA: hypothetical protein VD886_17760, partial [Herpetosiphonaceae bacterium]|nr:hypothetical protein [Herpetosiphonaceae bacterium]